MRKHFAVLMCLALAAGLLVSCGKAEGSRQLNVEISGQSPGRQSADNAAEAQTAQDAASSVSYTDNTAGSARQEQESFAAIATAETILGAKISGDTGSYKFSYKHPEIPKDLHFSVSLRIYREGAEGDILLESYDSDTAWLTQDGAYDPSEREVEVPLKLTGSLSDKYVLVSAKCFGDSISTYSAAAIHDYDGTESSGFEGVFAWES